MDLPIGQKLIRQGCLGSLFVSGWEYITNCIVDRFIFILEGESMLLEYIIIFYKITFLS